MKVHKYGAGKYPKPSRRKSEPVETTKVDPRVMKEALRLAEGDASRLKIISPTKVEVRDK